jgi:hypothetical protein
LPSVILKSAPVQLLAACFAKVAKRCRKLLMQPGDWKHWPQHEPPKLRSNAGADGLVFRLLRCTPSGRRRTPSSPSLLARICGRDCGIGVTEPAHHLYGLRGQDQSPARPNLFSTRTLRPANFDWKRLAESCVDCVNACFSDTNGGMVRRLQQLLQTVVCPPTPCCAPSYDELSAEGKRLGCAHRSRIDPVEVGRTPICRFFVGGGGDCWQGGGDGDNCAFRHITLAGERPPHCTWYFSSWGCKYGASCRHSHPLPRGGLLDECKLAGSMVAGRPGHDAALMAQRASGPNGGLCGMLAGKVVMLVGEGDFSFSFALFSRTPTPPAQLIATGLHDATARRRAYATAHESAAQSEEIDWQVPALQEWCGPTGPPPTVQLMHGVDATKLGESEAFKHFARFTDGDSVNRVLGWQFPFNGRADDAAGNGRILAAFFRSIATACLVRNRSATVC